MSAHANHNDVIIDRHSRQALNKLTTKAEIIEIFEAIHACRDPKDNKFLELAVNGKADYIITGDNDLLILHPFRAIPVLTPQAFLSCV
jgi:putative PIN family toxin of toxin-antitoxin system